MAKGNSGSSFFFIANLLNFVLATAIFTLPYPMYETGYLLGTIILAVTCFVSVTACTMIVEALGRKNSIIKNERLILLEALGENNSRTSMGDSFNDLGTNETQGETNLLPKDENIEENDEFYIAKRYEISKLAKILPKPLYFFVTITIICYLYVGVTSNGIIAGNNLKDIIGKTFNKQLPNYAYHIIVGIFFVIVISLALNNIKHLKKFSMFIMIMRFLVIGLIIGSCIYTMAKYGVADFSKVKPFNFDNITVMIGNSLFVFMSHHSIPGMVENFSPQKNLMKLLIIGYFCSFLFLVLYGYLSILAFGKKGYPCNYEEIFPAAIQSTFSSNLIKVPVIGFIINYYPILNVITSGMQLITLRNNILDAIAGCSPALSKKMNYAEQTGIKSVLKNFVFNTIVCAPPIILGLLLTNVQDLMKYFSSILGFLLMLPVPILVVSGYRFFYEKRQYIQGRLNISFLTGRSSIYIIAVIGTVIFSLIIYGFVLSKKSKKCIFEGEDQKLFTLWDPL